MDDLTQDSTPNKQEETISFPWFIIYGCITFLCTAFVTHYIAQAPEFFKYLAYQWTSAEPGEYSYYSTYTALALMHMNAILFFVWCFSTAALFDAHEKAKNASHAGLKFLSLGTAIIYIHSLTVMWGATTTLGQLDNTYAQLLMILLFCGLIVTSFGELIVLGALNEKTDTQNTSFNINAPEVQVFLKHHGDGEAQIGIQRCVQAAFEHHQAQEVSRIKKLVAPDTSLEVQSELTKEGA